MSSTPSELRYTEEHEYVKMTDEENEVVIGITDYAQGELGDIVFVELPEVGASFEKNAVFGSIEAVKAVSELFSPLSGEVIEINDALDADPSLINSEPYEGGWMVRMRISDPAELDGLMSADAYDSHTGS